MGEKILLTGHWKTSTFFPYVKADPMLCVQTGYAFDSR